MFPNLAELCNRKKEEREMTLNFHASVGILNNDPSWKKMEKENYLSW